MVIKNQEALNERANNLKTQGLNGFKLVLVTLHPDSNPTEAHLEVHFHNNNEITNILNDFSSDSSVGKQIFPISGGHRIFGGPLADQVKVVHIAQDPGDDTVLHLTAKPIGDYSTYSLDIVYQNIDPMFSEIEFKFRPGCFNLCTPDWKPAPKPKYAPFIDYMAKDYASFRHTLTTAMMERVPNWEATSEADLEMVLLELFSATADYLSDFQDRVMQEAYLSTARKRVSLARHARLMDYHIHQGNQASTWLALKLTDGKEIELPKNFKVWGGNNEIDPSSTVFITRQSQNMSHLLNQMGLYTWNDSIPALAAESTMAELKLLKQHSNGSLEPITDKASALKVQDLIRSGKIKHLLIQERLNPATGEKSGRDTTRRQLLKLLPGEKGAEADFDPLTATTPGDPLTAHWFVRVRWEEKDKLKRNYCFTVDCPAPKGKVEDVSLFNGNLVQIYHGRPKNTVFKKMGTALKSPESHTASEERHYQRTENGEVICKLPNGHFGPLAYKNTPPGGDIHPESTLEVEVDINGSNEPWEEVISLVHIDDSDEKGDCFIVETDEEGQSLLRFGNGINGKLIPEGAIIDCFYQVGRGLDGNIGADKLIHFEKLNSKIEQCWNPFDVINGRSPEPVAEIIRRVPEAYRSHQLRAITLQDYVDRAEELSEVMRASAKYMWTGSWRTVQVTIDPVGTTILTDEVVEKVTRHLNAVRLIGEDLEIRQPRFVPLDITVKLCIHPDYWPEHIKSILGQEFSDGYTPDGRMAFFHPDCWTFGQEIKVSQIIGRIHSIKGVHHVTEVTLKRWNEVTPGTKTEVKLRPNEIIQVKNDPDHMEHGVIRFDVMGGRQ